MATASEPDVRILDVFFLPPVAIGRLGGSPTPLECYAWDEDPTIAGAARTVITPDVSLDVTEDGSLRPYLPAHLRFRDGELYRPVAPFLELWAHVLVQGTQQEQPITLDLLRRANASLANLAYTVTAANRKAERRCGDPACGFEANLQVVGNDHTRHRLLASSPNQPGGQPLVFADRPIPLGFFQVIRPTYSTEMGVDLSMVRVRYTPAAGEVYGPPSATVGTAPGTLRLHVLVKPEHRILNAQAAWLQYDASYAQYRNPEPSDTYDGASIDASRSWGVVDDTCDVVVQAVLVVEGIRLQAQARVIVGPPHFAPDRRPFVSLADDLTDRDPAVCAEEEPLVDAQQRVNDLFQRALEVAGLFNLDANRDRGIRTNGPNPPQLPGLPRTDRASMTAADVPYADLSTTAASPVPHARLPLTDLIQRAHAQLADLDTMVDKLREEADRIRYLIRPPYGRFSELAEAPDATPAPSHRDPRVLRDTLYDMRMPPFMRDSDASSLSLTHRQYDELMALVTRLSQLRQAVVEEWRTAAPTLAPEARSIYPDTPIRQRVAEFMRTHTDLPNPGGHHE
jgi:hypothetical protein